MYLPPEPPVPFSLPYSGARLEWAIAVIGWSKNETEDRLDIDHGTFRQMLSGRRFIPDVLAIWLESLAMFHLTFSKPVGWRVKRGEDPGRFGDGTKPEPQDAAY